MAFFENEAKFKTHHYSNTPNSKVSRSGALSLNGKPASTPLSMASLPTFRFINGTIGSPPIGIAIELATIRTFT